MHIIAHRRQLLLGNGDGFALFIRPNVFRNSVCLWPVFWCSYPSFLFYFFCVDGVGWLNRLQDPQSPYRVQASFEMHDDDTHASGATWKSIIGYVSLILFVVSAMIGVYVTYKRYMVEPCSTISMHFSNPRGAHSSAQVQMQKPNEICIQRHRNGTELVSCSSASFRFAFVTFFLYICCFCSECISLRWTNLTLSQQFRITFGRVMQVQPFKAMMIQRGCCHKCY